MTQKVKYLILGCGIAGLGASIELKRSGINDTLILEKRDRVGGLNGNISIRGCDFDFGPKILLLDDSKDKDEILSYLNGNYKKYPVVERTYLSKFGLLGFPLQRYLIDLPTNERVKILDDLSKSRYFPKKVINFKDWLINSFGEYFCNLILFPYEEKKWQILLEDMDYKWTANRPIKVDYSEIIEGAKKRLRPNKSYYYPKEGNISNLTESMAKSAGQIQLNCGINSLNLNKKYVETDKGRFYYEFLISSLPLDFTTCNTQDLPNELSKISKDGFKRLSILVFNFIFSGNCKLDGTAIYFPEKKFCFRRISILQNLCPALAREGLTPISVEVSLKDDSLVETDSMKDQILSSFSKINGLDKLGKLLEWDSIKIDFAYPLQLGGLEEKIKTIHDYYSAHNVYFCGRGGTFRYCNSDIAYTQGKEVVKYILRKNDK